MSIYYNGLPVLGDKFPLSAVISILTIFSSNTAPTNPFLNQVWIDTSNSTKIKFKQWNGLSWISRFAPDFIWRDKESAEFQNPFFQTGYQLVLSAGSSIAFPYAYTAVPRVTATSSAKNVIVGVYAISTTGFTAATLRNDGVAANSNCNWHAIGRRD